MDLPSLAQLFGWTPRRQELLRALLTYRRQVKAAGLTQGFQWLDGSFLEHCEVSRQAEPRDLDLVTWVPSASLEEFQEIQGKMPAHDHVKATLKLDTYFAPCSKEGWLEPTSACYWFGFFGHTRDGRWKGIVLLDLAETENEGILEGEAAP